MIQYVSSCITAGAQEGLELHPTFAQKGKERYHLEDPVLGAAGKRLIKIDLTGTMFVDQIHLAQVRGEV